MKTTNLIKFLKKNNEFELFRDLTQQFLYGVGLESIYEDYLASEPEAPKDMEFFVKARAEFNKDLKAHEKQLGQDMRENTNPNDVWS